MTFLSGTTPQTHTYTGPLLLTVINKAVPDFDPVMKNDKLAHVVTATGSDGYRATVAWGEFDPDFEAKQIVVAITEDGVAARRRRPATRRSWRQPRWPLCR